MWRLDETEGPHRIRKKLEPQVDNSPSSRVDALEEITRGVNPPEPDTSSIMQVEVPPWAEAYEISATEVEGWLICIVAFQQLMAVQSRTTRPCRRDRGR